MNKNRRKWTDLQKRRIACKQDYKCAKCKNKLTEAWHCDHVVPLRDGSNDFIDNIEILCPNCHQIKSNTENQIYNDEQWEIKTKESKYFDVFSLSYCAGLNGVDNLTRQDILLYEHFNNKRQKR